MRIVYDGQFTLDHALKPEHRTYLERFWDTRHMQWRVDQIATLTDPIREGVGLPLGPEGAYFVGIADCSPRQRERYPIPYDGYSGYPLALKEYNASPEGVPGLWCDWKPGQDGKTISCQTREAFYHDVDWLKFLLKHFLQLWGYVLEGDVQWKVEGTSERGLICVRNNQVTTGDSNGIRNMTYDTESGIPTNLKEGDEIFLFDSEVGAMHDCSFLRYGIDGNEERTVTVIEAGEEKTYMDEGIADIVFQSEYPCN